MTFRFVIGEPVQMRFVVGGAPAPAPQKFPCPISTQFHTILDVALIGTATTDFEVQEDE